MNYKIILFFIIVILFSGCAKKQQEPVDNTMRCCNICVAMAERKNIKETEKLCGKIYFSDKDIPGCFNLFGENQYTLNDCINLVN